MMRRKEFEVADESEVFAVLDSTDWGTLGLAGCDGRPHLVPINHVRIERSLYFHGSPVGEKIDIIRENAHAQFSAVQVRSLIPSHFTDQVRACHATQFFKSVIATGRMRIVDDLAEKASALNALMKKLQPEGGYAEISAGTPTYEPTIRGIAILALDATHISAKFKLGQNLPRAKRELIAGKLRERGSDLDLTTAAEIEEYAAPPGGRD